MHTMPQYLVDGPPARTRVVRECLEAAGWSAGAGDRWDLAWDADVSLWQDALLMGGGRLLNRVDGLDVITTKGRLALTLQHAAARAAARGYRGWFDFVPETYVMPRDLEAWQAVARRDPEELWIRKPKARARGEGVELIATGVVPGREELVQRYVADPHLLDGHKYTLRLYALVASVEPLRVLLHTDGFAKLASRPFSLDPAHRADRYRHLTNPDVLRGDREAPVSARNLTLPAYFDRLAAESVDVEALRRQMRHIVASTVVAALGAVRTSLRATARSPRGRFELVGFDVTVDRHLKVWLLECNRMPSLSVEADAVTKAAVEEAAVKRAVVADTLATVGAIDVASAPGRFELVCPGPEADMCASLLLASDGSAGRPTSAHAVTARQAEVTMRRRSDSDRLGRRFRPVEQAPVESLAPGVLHQVSSEPRLYVADGFASPAEIEAVLALSADDAWIGTHGIRPRHDSTGVSMEMPVAGAEVLDTIARRIYAAVGVENDLPATLRFRCYVSGESHPPHLDTYTVGESTLIVTAMLCLVAPDSGGETYFEQAEPGPVAVQPRAGRLVLWLNHRPDGSADEASYHEALPVERGVKTTLTAFIYAPVSCAAASPASVPWPS